MFKNKLLLITDGTGSLGNAVIKRFLDIKIKETRIFPRDENKQYYMHNEYKNSKLKFDSGDVRNFPSINDAMYNIIYEFFPMESVRQKILKELLILSEWAK